MKTLTLLQGSAEWHAHRATHFNASDAPAMLGCSPYTSRTDLLARMKTGLTQEVDAATQRRFDDGHRFEALARPLAEEIIGEELYPVTGSNGELSASFDGLTMAEDIVFEHKSLNDELRKCLELIGAREHTSRDLPKHYRVQMEQQLLVSGAERVLFMASTWNGDRMDAERHCWYANDPALRAEIVAGWRQFAEDLATFTPLSAAAIVVAEAVQALPAVTVLVEGSITIKDNFPAFETALRDFLEHRLIREPKTDQDFATLDVQIKAMKGAEAALASCEAQMLAQIQTVDQAKRTKDMLAKLVRDNRLMAEKLLTTEKERRRGEIVAAGVTGLREHIAALNKRLGQNFMPAVPADFGGAVSGKKNLASMENAVATELARAKIAANEIADRISLNLAYLAEDVEQANADLFPDVNLILQKAEDDFRAVVDSRIAARKQKQQAERERIRAEEVARIERERQENEALAERQREADEAKARQAAAVATPAQTPAPAQSEAPAVTYPPLEARNASVGAANVVPMGTRAPAPVGATLRLGQINEALAPIALTAEGLASLGFYPVATEKAAKLFRAADLTLICDSLVAQLRTVQAKCQQAA